MELKLIDRAIKFTIFLAFSFAIPIAIFSGLLQGFSFLAGGLWGALNLLFIRHLVKQLLIIRPFNFLTIFSLLLIKFPLLYFSGYLLLSQETLSAMYLLLGSSTIFLVLIISALNDVRHTTAIVLLSFLFRAPAYAALGNNVPELPNFFSLLNSVFGTPLTAALHEWENILFSLIIAIAISIFFYFASRKREIIPHGIQNFVESIAEILNNFAVEIIGPEGRKFVPLLGTLFIFILTMNWIVLIPLMKPPTSSINITLALALCVFVLVQYLNFRNWGFFGFLYHLAGSPKGFLGWALVPLMLPIEILTQFTRPITLALRLFGNIVGEDILIAAAALFGVYLLSSTDVVGGIPVQLPFLFLALLTGLMQAFVFTLLTAIYILLSMQSHEEGKAH